MWTVGIVVALAIAVTLVLSMGLAALFWVPLLFGLGVVMWSVWTARRRRQRTEHRDTRETRDPQRAEGSWPTEGVIDDRLPEPPPAPGPSDGKRGDSP
jgi:hypothetical protein